MVKMEAEGNNKTRNTGPNEPGVFARCSYRLFARVTSSDDFFIVTCSFYLMASLLFHRTAERFRRISNVNEINAGGERIVREACVNRRLFAPGDVIVQYYS